MSGRPSDGSALRDRVVQVVLVLTALALVARLFELGARVAHQDEARVGYWTLRYLASGRWEYRPIVHGPFIPVVNRHLFALFGPSDFVARLPMAVLGAAMPATALLFRSRLRDSETVAMALLLAFNPVLLYYSRFMRQDLPLAALALLTLGLAVRAVDTTGRSRRRAIYAAGLVFGLAATTKENVLLYPVAWGGALFLVLDQRLFGGGDPVDSLLGLLPDPPAAAVAIPDDVRLVSGLAFLGTVPAVAAVAKLDGTTLVAFLAVSTVAYYGTVRGATVWHFLGGLPLAALTVLGLVNPAFDAGVTTFTAGIAWLLGLALLSDERLLEYGRPVATDGGEPTPDGDAGPDDETEATMPAEGTTPADRDGRSRPDADDRPTPTAAGTGGGRLRFRPLPPVAVAYVLALLVVVVFYAPRGGGYTEIGPDLAGWGLWSALAAGSLDGLGIVLREALYGTWQDFLRQWAGGAQDHAYIPFFLDFVKTLGAGALTLTIAAVAGTLYDRYGDRPREFVAFSAYWGFANVLGYPLVTDIAAPWATVHAIVGLAVPAAVALAAVYRAGRSELLAGADAPATVATDGGRPSGPDWTTVVAAAVVLLAAGTQVGLAGVDTVYENPTDRNNELVQYAQPASPEMKAVLADIRTVVAQNEGVDVLYYGDKFLSNNESAHDQPPAGEGWFDRFPLGYYTEMYSAQMEGEVVVESTNNRRDVSVMDAPVVVAMADNEAGTISYAATSLDSYLGNYSRYRGHRFLYDSGVRSSIVYFVDTDGLERPAPVYGDSLATSPRVVAPGPRERP